MAISYIAECGHKKSWTNVTSSMWKQSGNATTAPCKSSSRCIARYAHFQTASSLLGSMAYAAPLVFHPSLSIRLTSARIALSSAESRVLYILCCPTLATQEFSWCILLVTHCLLSRLWCMLKTFGFEVIHVQLYPEEVGREQNGAHSTFLSLIMPKPLILGTGTGVGGKSTGIEGSRLEKLALCGIWLVLLPTS